MPRNITWTPTYVFNYSLTCDLYVRTYHLKHQLNTWNAAIVCHTSTTRTFDWSIYQGYKKDQVDRRKKMFRWLLRVKRHCKAVVRLCEIANQFAEKSWTHALPLIVSFSNLFIIKCIEHFATIFVLLEGLNYSRIRPHAIKHSIIICELRNNIIQSLPRWRMWQMEKVSTIHGNVYALGEFRYM